MKQEDSAIVKAQPPISSGSARSGLLWGLVGVVAFSFTVPFTRIAVGEGGMSPLFIGAGRAVVAAVLAALALLITRQRLPRGRQWLRIGVVALGVVVGFPMLTSYALTTASASHGAVVIALLPAATAVAAVWRGGERPPSRFWVLAAAGATCAVAFALAQGGLGAVRGSDLLLFGAVVAAAIGYAEGGLMSRELGAWQTISWALVIAAPVMVGLTGFAAREGVHGTATGWQAFGYLGVVSMFLGFFAWYRGLAIGPMTTVSQVQLAQPVFGIAWAAMLLGESIGWATVLGGASVVACAALAVRTRHPTPREREGAAALRWPSL